MAPYKAYPKNHTTKHLNTKQATEPMENKMDIAVLFLPKARDVQDIVHYLDTLEITATILTPKNKEDITSYDGFIIPSFHEESFEKTKSEETKAILDKIRFEETKGKPVIALGNAAKLILENNFIPETHGYSIQKSEIEIPLEVTMINTATRQTPFTNHIKEDETIKGNIRTPHASFRIENSELEEKEQASIINNLFINDQVLFCYCNNEGDIEETEQTNPLQSIENIAAVTNRKGNVLAMFPEITIDHKNQNNQIFNSIKTHILEEKKFSE